MTPIEVAAIVGGVCAVGGFFAGVRYVMKDLAEVLARATPDQLRELARKTAAHRKRSS